MGCISAFLIEDRATIRENLTATLEELTPVKVIGFAAAEAEALEWLQNNQQDWTLLIVDIFLKSGSGLGVLSRMPAAGQGQSVVILSNYITEDIREMALQMGVTAVFDKSQDLEHLIDFCNDIRSAA